MVRLICVISLALLNVSPASAQEPGVLAIDAEAGRYAFSFRGEADALNMCGTTAARSWRRSPRAWAWATRARRRGETCGPGSEAATEGAARQGALDECERAGGPACEVLNVFCAEAPAIEAAAAPDAAQENLFWQSIIDSTDPADFEAYLRQYPDDAFRALARNRLAQLGAAATSARPTFDRSRRSSAATPCAASSPAAPRAGWRWPTGPGATSGTRTPRRKRP